MAKRKLSLNTLNDKEWKLLGVLRRAKRATIEHAAERAWPSRSRAQRMSWVRNALRRLVHNGLVRWVDDGTYAVTAKGRDHVDGKAIHGVPSPLHRLRLDRLPPRKSVKARSSKLAVKPAKKPVKAPAKVKAKPPADLAAVVGVGTVWRDCDPRRSREVQVQAVVDRDGKVAVRDVNGGPLSRVDASKFHRRAGSKRGFCFVREGSYPAATPSTLTSPSTHYNSHSSTVPDVSDL